MYIRIRNDGTAALGTLAAGEVAYIFADGIAPQAWRKISDGRVQIIFESNARNPFGNTPATFATYNGSNPLVELYTDGGFKIDGNDI